MNNVINLHSIQCFSYVFLVLCTTFCRTDLFYYICFRRLTFAVHPERTRSTIFINSFPGVLIAYLLLSSRHLLPFSLVSCFLDPLLKQEVPFNTAPESPFFGRTRYYSSERGTTDKPHNPDPILSTLQVLRILACYRDLPR